MDRRPRRTPNPAMDEPVEPDGSYAEAPCVLCGQGTRLRCAGCREPVCHACPACPNGCDEVDPSWRFGE
jgi:hypothetical protein